MLSVEEISRILDTIPVGYKKADDDFFLEANRSLFTSHKKLGVISNAEEREDDNVGNVVGGTEFFCHIPGCQLVFKGIGAYQTHFNSVHRFFCAECRRSFPTAHLLDLHVAEKHDSFFAARVARGEKMFQCFLEECKEMMSTPEERKEHCIVVHKFPANYRFDQLSGKSSSQQKGKKKPQVSPEEEEATMRDISQIDTKNNTKETTISFSFGHQKERTFNTKQANRNKTKVNKKAPDESLDDMHEIAEALNDID